ncbi:hypothetical protein, partial [Corynebacterium belfantii]|uniref:hypothetical protein n=1 Tax=Corynebacterium belfantii TaxID=2014537 RepID=UPI001A7E3052
DSTNATASALNCSEYNFGMINILPCPAPAKQARRQPNPQQTQWVTWWNESRIHQSLGCRAPAEVAAEFWRIYPCQGKLEIKANA